MAEKGTIELRFTGQRPRIPSKNEADWDARETARSEHAVLMTCDEVQEKISKSMGIEVGFVKQEGELSLSIGKLFDKTTMSVHIKEGLPIFAKIGTPGAWDFVKISEKPTIRKGVEEVRREIVEKAERNPLAFIEIDKEGATVVQYENYRM